MGIFDRLFRKKKKSKGLKDKHLLEAGVCPNCWGKQAYGDQFKEYVKDQTKSNINHDKEHQKAFIQQFVETNVTGIRLKREGDFMACPSCLKKQKYLPSKTN